MKLFTPEITAALFSWCCFVSCVLKCEIQLKVRKKSFPSFHIRKQKIQLSCYANFFRCCSGSMVFPVAPSASAKNKQRWTDNVSVCRKVCWKTFRKRFFFHFHSHVNYCFVVKLLLFLAELAALSLLSVWRMMIILLKFSCI